MSPSVRETVARNTKYTAAGRLWEAAVGLALTRYIVERVGVPAYGVWAIVGVFTGYVALLDFGVGSAFVKYVAEHAARDESDEISAVVSAGLFFYLVFGALLVAVGWPCVDLVVALFHRLDMLGEHDPAEVRFLLRWGLVLFAAASAASAFTSIQTGLQRMDITTLLSFTASLVKIAVTVAFLEAGYGLRGLLYANAASLAVFAGAGVVVAYRLAPGLRVSPGAARRGAFRRLFRFGVRAQVSRLSNLVLFETDLIVAGIVYRGFGLVGLYKIGVELAGKMRQVPAMLLTALVPAASDLDARAEEESLRRLYLVSTKYVAAVAVPLALFTAGCAGPLLRAWMGPREGLDMAAWVLRIIAIGYIANIVPGAGVSVALGKGRPELQMYAGLIATVSNVVLTVILALTIGFYGIPIATAASVFLSWVWFARSMDRLVQVSPGRVARVALLWPFAASAPGFVWCIALDVYSSGAPGFLANIGAVAAGAAGFGLTYLGLIRWTPFLDAFDLAFMKDTLALGRMPGFRLWTRRIPRV